MCPGTPANPAEVADVAVCQAVAGATVIRDVNCVGGGSEPTTVRTRPLDGERRFILGDRTPP